MSLKYLFRVTKKVWLEIILDLKAKDFAKFFHFVKSFFKQIFLGYPRTITIEPINICNLYCEFCSSPPALIERPQRAMSLKEFKIIIDNIKKATHSLWLFLAGEPFLNKDFVKMIAYANKANLHLTTSTNANLIDRKTSRELLSSGLDRLIISLDAASPKTYQKMRRGGDFEKVIKNIKFLIKEKIRQKKVKPKIELQFLRTKINQSEQEKFIKLAKSLKVNYCIKSLGIPRWILDEKKCQQIEQKYLPLSGKKRYDENKRLKRYKNCVNAKRSVILSDGTICICCYDIKGKYKLGNAMKDDFLSLWKSKKYRKIRKLMAKRALPLCKICGETSEL